MNRVSVEAAFYKQLSAWENLAYAARIYGTPMGGFRTRAEELLGRFGLRSSFLDRPLRSSRGVSSRRWRSRAAC